MEFITDLLKSFGSGLASFVSSLVQAIVPNVEAIVYKGTWADGVFTKAADGGYTTLFGFIVLGMVVGAGYAIFRIFRKKAKL